MPWKAYEQLFRNERHATEYAYAMSRDPDNSEKQFRIVPLGDEEAWKAL